MATEVSLDEIRAIIELVRDAENVAEFSLKYGDVEVALSRNPRGSPAAASEPALARPHPAQALAAAPTPAPSPPPTAAKQAEAPSVLEPQADEIAIKAPMVGTFYRAPKPGDPPFVEVGQEVRPDSVLCIIEVMKLMNSLQAGVEGVVTRILVADAQPVEYGQPLIFIQKSAS